MFKYAGDSYVDILNKVSGGVPNFGTLDIDDSPVYEHSYVIFNDKVSKDIYSIIVASGNIEPHFIYESFSPEYILPQTATVTKAEGNLIKEVNGLPIMSYMETLGLASNGRLCDSFYSVPHSIPFILDYTGQDVRVSRVLVSWNEDGYGVCGGLVLKGAQLSIGTWNKSDVIATTIRTINSILLGKNASTLLLYSCLSRIYALGPDILLEAEKANAIIVDRISYLFAYSGGEICPVNNTTNANSFHNNTIIACVF
jgi:hypothetical protein